MGMIDYSTCILTGLPATNIGGSVDGAEYYIEIENERYRIQFARVIMCEIKEFITMNKNNREAIFWLIKNKYWDNNASLSKSMLEKLFITASENNLDFYNLINK